MSTDECPGPGWVRLKDIPIRTLFITTTNYIGVSREFHLVWGKECVWAAECAGDHTFDELEANIWVYPIPDLAALIRENQEMSNLVHDRREEEAPWIERGAQQALGCVVKWAENTRFTQGTDWVDYRDALIEEINARGPILPPLPPDRLYAQNNRLKAALRKIFSLLTQPQPQGWTALISEAREVAEAALEEQG